MLAENNLPGSTSPDNHTHDKDYSSVGGGEPSTSIGEQDAEEEESLNGEYEGDDQEDKKDEVIDTNPEGAPHPVPDHGLVEEGPGPDA
ncbi:MAG: hypothetical protein INR73_03690 [Williamsia sp.]|nr:hypothetical protein [Williamsia sp.]